MRRCLVSRRSSTATKSLNRNKIKNMSYLINHDGLNQFCWLPSLLCGRLNALRKGATVRITVRLLLRHLKNSSVLFVIHRKKCFDLTICIFCQKNGAVFFSVIFSASSAAIGKTSGTWSSQTAAAGWNPAIKKFPKWPLCFAQFFIESEKRKARQQIKRSD